MVREGYKQTEVGVIPLDWEVVTFDEIFQFLRTGSNSRAQLSDYAEVKYIHYGDIHTKKGDRVLDFDRDSCVSIPKGLVSNLPELQEGDLVISDASEDFEGIGLSVELKNVGSKSVVGGLHTIALRDTNDRLVNGYKAYLTSISDVKSQIIKLSTGTTVYGISKSKLATVQIPLPPTQAEQRAIATALSDTDALLAALDALIGKKEAFKRGMMEGLLGGERRLEGFSGEWETRPLGELAHIQTGTKNNQDKIATGKYPFFVRSPTIERIDSYSYEGEAILVPGEGNIGSIFHYVNGKFEVHQRVYKIDQFRDDVFPKFIHHYMSEYFGRHAMENSVKATVDSLRLPTFQEFTVQLPPLPEQRAIATVLSDLDAELSGLRARRAKLGLVKGGMMGVLLSGAVRLI